MMKQKMKCNFENCLKDCRFVHCFFILVNKNFNIEFIINNAYCLK